MSPITVIGAGVAGLCVATELAARGAEVRLIDRMHAPGPHACSWWAGGMLAPFCEGESAEEPVVRLGQGAADWWQAQGASVTRRGTMVVTMGRDRAELSRFARRTEGAEAIGSDRIAELEPDLQGRCRQALFFAEEAHLDPRAALSGLIDGLATKGVTVEQGDPASTGQIVDCRGLAARDALADLRGVKGEMLVIRCPDLALARPIRLLHPRIPLYIVPRGDGIYMLGATVIEATERSRITARSLLEMLSAAYALHPAFGEAEILETGVDARPAFRDNLPRIRRRGRVVYANGLFRHGFLLGPTLAQQTADLVLDNKRPEFCDEDHPERGAA
ncbi:MAG: FAD-dependent oxidoreductase [Pseudomonadota bacterium]